MTAPLITLIVTSLGFALGAAGGATWMDAGELAAAGWQLGVAHPPGHPAFVMLAKLASLIPLGEIGFRVALVSSLGMGAAAAAVVAIAGAVVPRARLAALLAVLLLVLSPAVVFNARRVEVYGPTLALVGWAMWFAVVIWRSERAAPRHAIGAALCLGLAAAIHPIIAAVAGLPVIAAVLVRVGRRLRLLGFAAAAGVLGLSSYLLIAIRARAATPPELLWDVTTAAAYGGNFELSGMLGRARTDLGLLAEGPGKALLFAGLIGLLLGALTRLRGAALLFGLFAITVVAASLQSAINPDLRAYLLPALMACAVGTAIIAEAVARIAGSRDGPRLAAQAVVVGGVGLFGFCGAPGPEEPALGDPADTRAHFESTVAAMPPGPGVYFAAGDPTLFVAMYEQMVAGDRPDIAVASIELSRDIWHVEHLKRRVPALYVPYVDDGRAGNIAVRMAVRNMRIGSPVGSDLPAFGSLEPALASPVDRGYRLGLEPADAGPDQKARRPPGYTGHVGRKVSGAVGLTRAKYELRHGRPPSAAWAAGFAESWVEAVNHHPRLGRPALFVELPALTPVLIHAEWLDRLMLADMLWRLGADPVPIRGPDEQKLLGVWQRLLGGDPEGAEEALSRLDLRLDEATTRVLMSLERLKLAEFHIRALLARRGELPGQLALLGSVLGQNTDAGSLAEAEALFLRAIEIDADNPESHYRLGVIRAKRGNLEGAKQAWRRTLELAPGRRDAAALLERAEKGLVREGPQGPARPE